MKIHNIRYGFAPNSSSTHSLIFKKGRDIRDNMLGETNFGWEYFTVYSRELKLKYLASTLLSNLVKRNINPFIASQAVINMTGIDLKPDKNGSYDEWWIDHQSEVNLPVSRRRNGIDLEFFNDFKEYILRDDIAIIGGNDNEYTDKNPYGDECFFFDNFKRYYTLLDSVDKLWARKGSGYWSLFNIATGDRIRFAFDKLGRDKQVITKGSFPELVDMNITNYCHNNCAYCYRNSMDSGRHADFRAIESFIYNIGEIGSFEIVLGGGDVLFHPDIDYIIDLCGFVGIIPNFTVKDSIFLNNPAHRKLVNKCGCVAISTESISDIIRLDSNIVRYGLNRDKFALNIVEGLVDTNTLSKMLETSYNRNLKVILLGFKNTGRAIGFMPLECNVMESINSLVSKSINMDISFDTCLIKKYKQQLNDMGIERIYYDEYEGSFSMFIDAVEMKASASSFSSNVYSCDSFASDDILRIFESI